METPPKFERNPSVHGVQNKQANRLQHALKKEMGTGKRRISMNVSVLDLGGATVSIAIK